jgi:hypothetical protein
MRTAWRGTAVLFPALVLATALVAPACGDRTGLLVDDLIDTSDLLDGSVPHDATTFDAPTDHRPDAPPDARADVIQPHACKPGTCASLNYQCGKNGDGCGNVIDCGPCPVQQVCGAQKYAQCGKGPPCVPKTCADLGFNCGPAGDGCGGLLQCGICQFPDACGGAGKPGHCGNTLQCTNLCLQQVTCDSGTTTVTGKVVAGTLAQYGPPDPIYNALVYVPNAPVDPFKPGVQCTQCGEEVSGKPLVATQTLPDGTFTLTNVPVGANIPLVIQLGRWRRQVTIPNVAACTKTALAPDLTRMPRNQSEGDIPLIALSTGNADGVECVLLKMGIDKAEFTTPTGGGRVQMYVSTGATLGASTPAAQTLWDSSKALAAYDMVVLPCEGRQITKPVNEQQNLVNYMSAGGRAFITHYGYTWLDNIAPFSQTASFAPNTTSAIPTMTGVIDTSFVDGQSYSSWLKAAGALSGPNQLSITNARQNLNSVATSSQQFITDQTQGFPVQYAFFTPVGAPASQQCGRVVYNDFHVTDGAVTTGVVFPNECSTAPLTPQEKALEFMLFDLAACIPPPPANCTPRTCKDQNIQCGPAGDGCGQQLDCGPCTTPDSCGGANNFQCGVPDAGACIPKTCADLQAFCGLNGDGCGNVIDCGTCVMPQTCGGGGTPNVCGQ